MDYMAIALTLEAIPQLHFLLYSLLLSGRGTVLAYANISPFRREHSVADGDFDFLEVRISSILRSNVR